VKLCCAFVMVAAGIAWGAMTARAQAPDFFQVANLYRLNGDTIDSYGTNHGTYSGVPLFLPGPRPGSQSAQLAANSFIRCGVNFPFDRFSAFSAFAWVKGAGSDNDSTIVGKMVHGGQYSGWELHVGTPAGGSGEGKLNVWLINTYGPNFIQVNSPVVVLDNAWHFVGFTYDGSSRASGVRIYVDGTNATGAVTADTLTASIANNVELNLGARMNGADHTFTGGLSEVSLWNATLSPAEVQFIYANGIPVSPHEGPVFVREHPQARTNDENTTVTFSGLMGGQQPIAYQWLRNGVEIPGATSTSLTFSASFADDGAVFALAATNSITNTTYSVVSSNAVLTVRGDTIKPTLFTARGATLTGVELKFSEPVSSATATNTANYFITATNGPLAISNAVLSSDGKTVTLVTAPQTQGADYTLTVSGLADRAFNPNFLTTTQTTFHGLPFALADVGSEAPLGSIAWDGDALLVTAGGDGTRGTNDQFVFGYQQYAGDFDVRVRVTDISLGDVWSRAALIARESIATDARFVAVIATPTLAGCFLEWRRTNGFPVERAGSYPPNLPDVWLRLKRAGNSFSAYAGNDSVSWSKLGDLTLSLNSNVLVGMGVASAFAGSVTARLSDFGNGTSATAASMPDVEPPGPSSRKTPIVITEIHYSPPPRADSNDVEFVELFNSNPWPEDISGYRLSGAVDFTFAENTRIAGGAYRVVAASPGNFSAVYGMPSLGPYTNRLQDSGTLRLRNKEGAVLLEVPYRNEAPWPVAPDGTGHSLVLQRPTYGEGDPRAWGASEKLGGSPGAYDGFRANPWRDVVINEFRANSTAPAEDFIELYNHSASAVDLSGCTLSDRASSNRFAIPAGTTLGPGEFVSFASSTLGFGLNYERGKVFLRDPGGRVLDAVSYEGQEANISAGRFPNGASVIRRLSAPTPGASNSGLLTSPVVLNEIMFDPISRDADDQFIELFNAGPNAADLGGWKLRDGISFTFPTNTTLAPGAFLVVAENAARLMSNYANLNAANTLGNFSGRLSGSSERVALSKPLADFGTNELGQPITNTVFVDVEEVTYRNGGPWGKWANGGGSSLERLDPRADPSQPSSWATSDETAKAPWTIVEATGYIDIGGTYNNEPIDRLELHAMGEGEWLVDDVQVTRNGGPNLIANPAFDLDIATWTPQGNHIRTTASNLGEGWDGLRAMRVRASDGGDTGANRIRTPLLTPLLSNDVCTIRAKVRWLMGHPEIVLRTRGNFHELFVACTVPANLGTPGAVNSRAVPNAPPAIYDVTYAPVLPAANEPVVVTTRVTDSDGVSAVTLNWRADPATSYATPAMRDDGTGGDAVAGDGIFTATIPGQTLGTLVAMYVTASDGAVVSQFPNDAPANELLVRFGDPPIASSFGTYRLWLTQNTVQRWAGRPFLDNEPLPGTFVVGNFRAIQFARGTYAGSAAHQTFSPTPTNGPASFGFDLPADSPLLGTDAIKKIHAPGNSPGEDTTLVREPMSHYFARQMGIPSMNVRHVAWVVNGVRQGLLLQDIETPNGDVVRSRFPNDDGGELYKLAIRYEFQNVDQIGAGFNPFTYPQGATLSNWITSNVLNGSLERKMPAFRWVWQPRGGARSANNYSNFFMLVDAATDFSGARIRELMDFDEWSRHVAVDHMTANWDSYANQNGQNLYIYKDKNTPWHALPWDRNIVFYGDTRASLFAGHAIFPDPPWNAIIAENDFRRLWWGAYHELAYLHMLAPKVTDFLTSRFAAFRAAGVNAASPDAIASWIEARRLYLIQRMAAVDVAFTVSPTSITTQTNVVTLTGTAAPWVANITADASPLSLSWTSVTDWSARLTVPPGTSTILVRGWGRDGALLGQVPVTIHNTGGNTWAAIRINEWMASNTGFIRDPADNDTDDWFELYNPTASPVDLTGWALSQSPTNATGFVIGSGYVIPANGYLLVWADSESSQNATNRDLHVNFKLSKDGDAIALFAPDRTLIDYVAFGAQSNNVSEGRWPDGGTYYQSLDTPTPGAANSYTPPPPRIISIRRDGTNITVTFATTPGVNYAVQFKNELGNPAWSNLFPAINATNSNLSVADSATAPARFYRVERMQ